MEWTVVPLSGAHNQARFLAAANRPKRQCGNALSESMTAPVNVRLQKMRDRR